MANLHQMQSRPDLHLPSGLFRGAHERFAGIRLFTLFFCWDCYSNDDGCCSVRTYLDASETKAVPIVPVRSPQTPTRPCWAEWESDAALPDWDTICDDFPEIATLACDIDHATPRGAYHAAEEELVGESRISTYVGGYPHWIQGACRYTCPRCNRRMRFLAQVDSENEAGYMWGDVGCAYLFFCEDHPNAVAFEEQCCCAEADPEWR